MGKQDMLTFPHMSIEGLLAMRVSSHVASGATLWGFHAVQMS